MDGSVFLKIYLSFPVCQPLPRMRKVRRVKMFDVNVSFSGRISAWRQDLGILYAL